MIGLERWESSIMKPVQNFKIQLVCLDLAWNSLSLSFSLYSALNLQEQMTWGVWIWSYHMKMSAGFHEMEDNIELIWDISSLSNSERQESSGICCTSWYLLVRILVIFELSIWNVFLHWNLTEAEVPLSLSLFFSRSRWRKHCWHAFLDGNGSAFQVFSQISQKMI